MEQGGPCADCLAAPLPPFCAGAVETPRAWRAIVEHPRIRPGRWVPQGERTRVLVCERCESLWYLFFDPKELCYTDVFSLPPGFSAVLDREGALDEVWPFRRERGRFLSSLVSGYFGGALFDPDVVLSRLVDDMGDPRLSGEGAEQLLLCVRSLLQGEAVRARRERAPGKAALRLERPAPLVKLIDREELFADGDGPSRRRRMRDWLEDIARHAFGKAFGGAFDLVAVSPDARAVLVVHGSKEGRVLLAATLAEAASHDLDRASPSDGADPERDSFGLTRRALRRLEEAITELVPLSWESKPLFSSESVRALVVATRRIEAWVDEDTHEWDPARALGIRYRELLEVLERAGRLPAEVREEVLCFLGTSR